jgi:hypothetical protein
MPYIVGWSDDEEIYRMAHAGYEFAELSEVEKFILDSRIYPATDKAVAIWVDCDVSSLLCLT